MALLAESDRAHFADYKHGPLGGGQSRACRHLTNMAPPFGGFLHPVVVPQATEVRARW